MLSDMLHREGKNQGRICESGGGRWTVNVNDNQLHAWRDGVSADQAILDWAGNNAVVECCEGRNN